MDVVLWVVLATVVGSALIIVPILLSEGRARGRLERAVCGDCGVPFGRQDRPRVWGHYGPVVSDRHLPIQWGPLMRCVQCRKEWPYDRSGRPYIGPFELPRYE